MSGVLKPCPFCGGKAEIRGISGHLYGGCTSCFCEGPIFQATRVEVIEVWNTRADDVDHLKKALHEWSEVSQANYQRAKAAEAKLAKAVEAFETISDIEPDPDNMGHFHDIANTAIAELKGGNDD